MKLIKLGIGLVGITPLMGIVSCNNTQKVENDKPNIGVDVPNSDKIPAKVRLKLVIPFTTSYFGEPSNTTYKSLGKNDILKYNNHIKDVDYETLETIIKGRLLENAITSKLEYNKHNIDSFFTGVPLFKDAFENMMKLYDKETIFIYENKTK